MLRSLYILFSRLITDLAIPMRRLISVSDPPLLVIIELRYTKILTMSYWPRIFFSSRVPDLSTIMIFVLDWLIFSSSSIKRIVHQHRAAHVLTSFPQTNPKINLRVSRAQDSCRLLYFGNKMGHIVPSEIIDCYLIYQVTLLKKSLFI